MAELTYTRVGDYYIPDALLSHSEQMNQSGRAVRRDSPA